MKLSTAALSDTRSRLENLEKARPAELDNWPEGFAGVTYPKLLEMLRGWQQLIDAAGASTWADSAQAVLDDPILARKISLVGDSISSEGINNGTHWMLVNGAFLQRVSDVNEYISLIATRRSQVSRYLAKELAKDISSDAALIRDAAPLTKSLLQASLDLEGATRKLSTLSEETKERLDAATQIAESFNELKDSAEEAQKIVLERQTETERFHAEALSFRNKSEEEASKFEARLAELEQETGAATDLLSQSRAELNIALSDVKRSGLASAFTERATSIRHEKYVWMAVFVTALGALTWLAIVFAVDLKSFTYELLIVALLRRISLAAPAVWAGWYAAKQVSRLNLIQEDYEYKAATALAFESYNNEVEESGDSELVKDLLKTTIKNFGDNPVRLYESPEQEAATPTQELIKKLESDGTLTLMQRLKSLLSP